MRNTLGLTTTFNTSADFDLPESIMISLMWFEDSIVNLLHNNHTFISGRLSELMFTFFDFSFLSFFQLFQCKF